MNSSPLTGTTYRDLSVTGQTTYYYVVQAVNATGIGAAPAEAMATTPPPPVTFTQNSDIGVTQQAGSEQYAAGSGVYTVSGGGGDIRGSSDSFHFDALSLSGDGSIVAQVTSVQNTSSAAKAGIMFRDSTAANAMMAMLAVTPGAGLLFETRTSTGGLVSAQLAGGFATPIWLELSRTGTSSRPTTARRSFPAARVGYPGLARHGADIQYGARGVGGYSACRCVFEHEYLFRRERLGDAAPQAVPAPNPGVLQFTASTNSLRIACDPVDPSSVDVYVNSAGSPASTIPLSQLTQWQVLGGAGGDQLTVDFSHGDPLPTGGLSFAGGSGSGTNGLTIIGNGSADSITLSPTQLTFDALAPIVYSNVQTVAVNLSVAHCSLAGSLAAGTSLVLASSGSITPAAGFTQAGNLTVRSGSVVLNASSELASGASLTVGDASAFDASAASFAAVNLANTEVGGQRSEISDLRPPTSDIRIAGAAPAVSATAAAVNQTAGPSRTPADIHGAAILAEVNAFDEWRGIDFTWLAEVNDTVWPSRVDRWRSDHVAIEEMWLSIEP